MTHVVVYFTILAWVETAIVFNCLTICVCKSRDAITSVTGSMVFACSSVHTRIGQTLVHIQIWHTYSMYNVISFLKKCAVDYLSHTVDLCLHILLDKNMHVYVSIPSMQIAFR